VPIGSDGTIAFREGGERIMFSYLLSSKYVGDTIQLKLLRNGLHVSVSIQVTNPSYLVHPHLYHRRPSYFIHDGLVFTSLSRPFLQAEYGNKWDQKAPINLCEVTFYGYRKQKDQEVVILSQVLVDEVNVGYEHTSNGEVLQVNGIDVKNLLHLATLILTNKDPLLRISMKRESVIILTQDDLKRGKQILLRHSIPSSMSEDIQTQLQTLNLINNEEMKKEEEKGKKNKKKKKIFK